MRSVSLTDYYEPHYRDMRIVINRLPEIHKAAKLVMSRKAALYMPAEKATGVPWIMFGVTHYREGNCNPLTNVLNGQRWDRVTTITPKGLGPWPDWISCAQDAAERHAWVDVTRWSIAKMLQEGERYNGLGYANMDKDSPYVFSCTHWGRGVGKYVADGVYDTKAVDKQVGIAPIIKAIVDSGAWTP